MSKENRVSDERLADLIKYFELRDPSASHALASDTEDALTELQSLRSKPVAGVSECIKAIKTEVEKPIDGPEHGAWDRGKRDGLRKAINIISTLSLPTHKPLQEEG